MTSAPIIPVNVPNTNAPPVWDDIPFDVECPRCGLDLHGSTASNCGQCGLTLDWTQLVPLDELRCVCGYALRGLPVPRCPECGTIFDWNDVVDQYRRRKKEVFEYRWRKRPVRSYFRSMSLAMRPWKLWREIDIYDPLDTRGLWLLLVLSVVVDVTLAVGVGWLGVLIVYILELTLYGYPPRQPIWQESIEWIYHWYAQTSYAIAGNLFHPPLLLFVACSAIGVWGTLMILRQSMRRTRVRVGHAFRAFVYVALQLPVLITLGALYHILLEVGVTLSNQYNSLVVWNDLREAKPYLTIAAVLWMTAALGLAYRRYLRMPHAWGVAVVAAVIGLLFGMCVAFIPYFVLFS